MPSLQIDQVCYGWDAPLGSALSLQAKPGEVWAILGENGVGKSALLHTLGGLKRPLGGRVLVDGVDIARCPKKLLARRLGLLLQQPPLPFPFSVWESVAAGRYAHRKLWCGFSATDEHAVAAALTAVGLNEKAAARVDRLSGGEQRRVAIATLLAQEPGVLLLDEPANHLDLRHQALLLKHLCAMAHAGDRLLIMSMHDVNLAASYADQVLLLYPDGSHESGPVATLLDAQKLSRLYTHPLRVIRDGERALWIAE